MATVDNLVNNAWLTLLGRLGMVLVIPVASGLVGLGGLYMNARFEQVTEQWANTDQRVRSLEAKVDDAQKSINTVQVQQAVTAVAVSSGDKAQAASDQATSNRLDKMTDAITALSVQVSGLNATIMQMNR